MFQGFPPKALRFFQQLEKNNRREWFTPRKEQFEELVRQPMIELVTELLTDFRKFAVDYVPPDPAKALYRIYRDTRFSRDKTPYKVHIAAHFQHQKLPKNRAAGYFVAISHKEVELAGGIYMPGPEELLAVRQAILKQPETFRKLVEDRSLVRKFGPLQGTKFARVPKAYPQDHALADWLRMKNFYFYAGLEAKEALQPGFKKTVIGHFRSLEPIVTFFNESVLAALKKDEPDRPVRPDPMF